MNEEKLVVPHFHYDYLWCDTPDVMGARAARLIKKGLRRIRINKNYKFVIDSVMALKYFRLHYPENWRELIGRVWDKKIDLIGGMLVAPDTHLPKGETLIRQILYGKRFLMKEFGIESNIGYLIDSFGHTEQLPQILKKSGFDYFLFMRGGKALPDDFIWMGLDNTGIFTHKINRYYRLSSFNKKGLILKGYDNYLSNHLGKCSLPIDYFESWNDNKIPIVEGELNNEEFEGTYSSRVGLKQKIKELENKYYLAELLSILMDCYPETMEKTISRICCCCFHDGITGTHTDKVNKVIMKMLSKSEKELDCVINDSLERLTKNISISLKLDYCTSLLVFNPTCVKRTDVAEFKFEHPNFVVKDENGDIIPHQEDYFHHKGYLIEAENIPAFGYKIYYIDDICKEEECFPEFGNAYLVGYESYIIEMETNKGDIYLLDKRNGEKYKEEVRYAGVVDDGLIREVYKFRSKIGNTSITQYITVDLNDRSRKKVRITVNNKHKNSLIRVKFFNYRGSLVFGSIPFGMVTRGKGHFPITNFCYIGSHSESTTILTKGLQDLEINKNSVYLTLLRGVGKMSKLKKPVSFPFRIPKAQELGKHIFEFCVIDRSDGSNPHLESLEYNFPLITKTFHNGGLKYKEKHSFIKIKPAEVIITSIKKAEEDNDTIIRIFNTTRENKGGMIIFDSEVKEAKLVDLLEVPVEEIKPEENRMYFKIKPFEILTFKIKK